MTSFARIRIWELLSNAKGVNDLQGKQNQSEVTFGGLRRMKVEVTINTVL
jgi:hypothetical protein